MICDICGQHGVLFATWDGILWCLHDIERITASKLEDLWDVILGREETFTTAPDVYTYE